MIRLSEWELGLECWSGDCDLESEVRACDCSSEALSGEWSDETGTVIWKVK